MKQKNREQISILHMVSDGFMVGVSYVVGIWLCGILPLHVDVTTASDILQQQGIVFLIVAASLLLVLLFAVLGIYNASRTGNQYKTFLRLLLANLINLMALGNVRFLGDVQWITGEFLLLFTVVNMFLLMLEKRLIQSYLRFCRRKGRLQDHVLVAGTGALAQKYASTIAVDKMHLCKIDGFVGEKPQQEDMNWLGGFDTLEELLDKTATDAVIMAIEAHEIEWIIPIISLCEKYGTKVVVVPFYNDVIPTSPTIDVAGDIKLINLRSNPLDNVGYAALKRLGDVLISLVFLIVLSPVFMIAAIGIKLSSPGPVFFRQTRVGRFRKHFQMFKFRSMVVNDQQDSAWSSQEDSRRTVIGRVLRKFSIDELPQLINVLLGDMSLIGPRPEIPYYVERFKEGIPLYMIKHQVRPGMTGWAQINGYRGNTSIVKRIEYDIWYIENWSIGLDALILLRTMLSGWINRQEKLFVETEN